MCSNSLVNGLLGLKGEAKTRGNKDIKKKMVSE